MSYTIIDDGDEINIRAVITQRWELAELVTKLQQRVDGLPVDITTYVEPPAYSTNSTIVENATGSGATAHFHLDKTGAVTEVTLTGSGLQQHNYYDNRELPRKELSDDRT